jgi:hypothetical protein
LCGLFVVSQSPPDLGLPSTPCTYCSFCLCYCVPPLLSPPSTKRSVRWRWRRRRLLDFISNFVFHIK